MIAIALPPFSEHRISTRDGIGATGPQRQSPELHAMVRSLWPFFPVGPRIGADDSKFSSWALRSSSGTLPPVLAIDFEQIEGALDDLCRCKSCYPPLEGARISKMTTASIKRFEYIDALRGYAILGVIAVHSSQLFPGLERPIRDVADQGARGVQLFFVVSALTLMASWQSRDDGALAFYIRRAFRIAPMFWIAIAYYTISGRVVTTWQSILASVMLLHGFHPATISDIVPGGWSIADEAIFYATFPFLAWALRSWQVTVCTLLGSIALIVACSLTLASHSDFWGASFPFQFPAFLVGILVFHLLQTFSGRLPDAALQVGLFCGIAFVGLAPVLAYSLAPHLHWTINFVLFGFPTISYSLSFGLIAFCFAEGAGRALTGAVIRHVGKVSYSAYFWHFAVLELIGRVINSSGATLAGLGWVYFLLTFAAAAAVSIAGATITFRLIEQPMTKIGHRLAWQSGAHATAGLARATRTAP
jgi:exopolysaccharide production protein ExoZ